MPTIPRRSSRDFGPDWPRDFGAPEAVRFSWRYDDGGRAAAGFPARKARDCGPRAAAIALGLGYVEAFRLLANLCPLRRDWVGTPFEAMDALMSAHDFAWTPTEEQGARLRTDELPDASPVVVYVFRHFTVVVNGVIRDTIDPSRDVITRVRGHWHRPQSAGSGEAFL